MQKKANPAGPSLWTYNNRFFFFFGSNFTVFSVCLVISFNPGARQSREAFFCLNSVLLQKHYEFVLQLFALPNRCLRKGTETFSNHWFCFVSQLSSELAANALLRNTMDKWIQKSGARELDVKRDKSGSESFAFILNSQWVHGYRHFPSTNMDAFMWMLIQGPQQIVDGVVGAIWTMSAYESMDILLFFHWAHGYVGVSSRHGR
jgi:hypothetical protein